MRTITKEFTKEQLQQIIETDHVQCGEASALARIALASLEAEPVAYIIQDADARSRGEKGILRYFANISDEDINEYQITVTPLYTAPPAPVSVPDERYQHLSELYHAQEKRLFKLAQRIKGPAFDKYAYSPSQAIDVLESAIFGEREDDCRAAMLQGAEPVTTACKLPDDFICMLTGRAKYLREKGEIKSPELLERAAAALQGGSVDTSSIPNGWKLVPIDPTKDMLRAGQSVVGFWLNTVHCYSKMLAAAPPAPVSDEDKVLAEQARAVVHCLDMCGVPSGDYADNEQLQLWGRVIEYGRHPASVSVPDGYRLQPISEYDAMCAAMLQGADGNSPVIPDGWVACSERMPEQFKAILAFNEYGEVWSGAYDRYWNFYCDNLLVEHVTHWMPLPAAPQQEVTQALAKGMERYGDAMQKLADSGD